MTALFPRSRLLRALTAIGACIALLVPAATTTKLAQASSSPASAGTLTIGINSALETWDPSLNESTLPRYWLLQPVYDTLIRESTSGKYVPSLASHWARPNPTTFVMSLRTGVKFSDGTAFNAAAVKANIDHARTDKGQEATLLANIKSVKVVNSKTVKLNLTSADPDLESHFARFDEGAMVSPKAIPNAGALAQAPVGTGPYVLNKSQSVTNDHYTFTRKKSYWAGFKAFPYKTVVVKIIPDNTSLLNATTTGQVDVDPMGYPTSELNDKVQQAKSGGLQVLKTAPNAINIIGLLDRAGKKVPAMKNIRVRQALNYAIDRKALIQPYFHGYGKPISGILPPSSRGYDKKIDNYYAYNPKKAKALLKAAGYANGFTFTLLTIPQGLTSAELIAGFLKKIGVTMNIQTSTNFAEFYTDKWESIPGSISVPSAYTMVQAFYTSTAFFNPFHATDPKLISLAKKASAAKGASQTKIMRQIDDEATKYAPVITMGGGNSFIFYSKKVTGLQQTKRGNVYFYGWHPK